jgi:uncharacterized SAM-binding protein YcdF (DUF218 family)
MEIRIPLHNIVHALLLLIAATLLSVFLFYLINLILIFPWPSSQLVRVDTLEPCDLIVFLGGGSGYERFDYALKLCHEGYGRRLYTPHLIDSETREYISQRIKAFDADIPFFSGHAADSTYNEALETKEYVKIYDFDSILLVTSPYHSLRAGWIFQKVMPKKKIIVGPCCLKAASLQKKLSYYHPYEKQKFFLYYLCYAWRDYSIE